ncbi:hypothetical protein BC351_14790 [Paenibacillus ferrarius]|uniref:Glycosyltransferase 2-like domain-containing protein n=1 Tax=Paenibacillus ferrarius TaxID=1469647 RepID=A0A1V4HRF5_9BACL|nr:TPR domain-containing glycosyltransferase [Paenibacillus ferrarius]OPH61210.1 hypothetical protein BC351_14790 [Paenibacillus ferrarius]
MSTVGIHIIMKDESEWLRQCLESVKDAEEIIVIDTGSQDSSIRIAKSYGAKVFFSRWEDDFSTPRNQALQIATTDWVFYLDADEILLSGLAAIKEQIDSSDSEAFTVILENLIGTSLQDHLLHRSIRLFRNNPNYRFQGIIHEDIGTSIVKLHPSSSIKDSEIRIRHFGYMPENIRKKDKIARNERLLQKALQTEPANPYYSYNLGITFCQSGKLNEAKDAMIQALMLARDDAPYRATLVKDLSKILLELREIKQVELLLLKETERYEDYPDLHYILGQSFQIQGLWEQAYEQFRKASTLQNNKYVTEAGASSFLVFYKMGEITQNLGSLEESARLFNQTLQHHSTYAPALLGISEVFHELDVPWHEIAALLKVKVHPSIPSEHYLLLDTLVQVGAFEEAIAITPISYLTDSLFLKNYCLALIHLGHLKEADHLLQNYIKEHPVSLELEILLQWRAICNWQLDESLQTDFFASLPEHLITLYQPINEFLSTGHMSTEFDNNSLSELATSITRQSIVLGQMQLIDKLYKLTGQFKLELTKMLYGYGYILTAAEHLISLSIVNQLDDEGLFDLGEILFDKGHYLKAAEMFESILLAERTYEKAKTAAAICYLHLAEASLSDALSVAPGAPSFKEDLQQIRSSIRLLNRTGWHTQWYGRQRRIFDGQKYDFAMHDRKE